LRRLYASKVRASSNSPTREIPERPHDPDQLTVRCGPASPHCRLWSDDGQPLPNPVREGLPTTRELSWGTSNISWPNSYRTEVPLEVSSIALYAHLLSSNRSEYRQAPSPGGRALRTIDYLRDLAQASLGVAQCLHGLGSSSPRFSPASRGWSGCGICFAASHRARDAPTFGDRRRSSNNRLTATTQVNVPPKSLALKAFAQPLITQTV
jgi:hypothetical protein